MTKIAVFVEVQTELVFVREYLLKWFGYENISIECYTLRTDNSFHSTEYAFPNDNVAYFYQIINVGNDSAVLTRILNREKYLWNIGFHRIIGLRDMYSEQYKELNSRKYVGKINPIVVEEIKAGLQETIKKRALRPNSIDFCYAVMETESWILGFHQFFVKINPILTTDFIESRLGFDLSQIDPELTFYHPARTLEEIYELGGEKYNKSKGNIAAIMDALQKEDFESLLQSGKCSSFRHFATILVQ